MHWKNDVFNTKDPDVIRPALKEYIREKLRTEAEISVCPCDSSFSMKALGEQGEWIFSFLMEFPEAGSATIKSLNVTKVVPASGLGTFVFKLGLGIASAYGVRDRILVSSIINDGFSYWPRMGSLPLLTEEQEDQFSQNIYNWLKQFGRTYYDSLSEVGRQEICRFENIAQQNPYLAWRAMSQTDVKFLDGGKMHRHLFAPNLFEEDHILFPGEPRTRRVLQKRVGNIPAFSFSSENYGHIARALQCENASGSVRQVSTYSL